MVVLNNLSHRISKSAQMPHNVFPTLTGLQDMTPQENLFLPDGTFKPQLRNTIQDALLVSRFDSVSTVLMDSRWTESQTGIHLYNQDLFCCTYKWDWRHCL